MSSSLEIKWNHQEARDGLFLTIGAVSPFILRSLGDWIISFILDKCCKMTKKDLAKHLVGRGDSDVTIDNVWDGSTSWNDAKHDLGLNQCAAITIATIRLLFWHWLQPLLYCYVLYAYWDLLLQIQQLLGLIVGGREVMYCIMTLIALCRNPIYLLVDLRSTWKESKTVVAVYVIAPEKYVAAAIANNADPGKFFYCFLAILPVLDCAGIAAFVTAMVMDNVYIPLMIGYGVTTIGGLLCVVIICVVYCRLDAEEEKEKEKVVNEE